MKRKNAGSKFLIITGTILTWLPILFPVLNLIVKEQHLFDYLMPVELFFVSLVGGVLLFIVAIWVKSRVKIIGWGLGISILIRIGIEVLGYFRGLYSDDSSIEVWNNIILTVVALYSIPVIIMGIGGILLWVSMLKNSNES